MKSKFVTVCICTVDLNYNKLLRFALKLWIPCAFSVESSKPALYLELLRHNTICKCDIEKVYVPNFGRHRSRIGAIWKTDIGSLNKGGAANNRDTTRAYERYRLRRYRLTLPTWPLGWSAMFSPCFVRGNFWHTAVEKEIWKKWNDDEQRGGCRYLWQEWRRMGQLVSYFIIKQTGLDLLEKTRPVREESTNSQLGSSLFLLHTVYWNILAAPKYDMSIFYV